MNIFALDKDPRIAAHCHGDKHVIKMILESAQLLSTAWHMLAPGRTDLLKPTHVNHPCAVWVRCSTTNYRCTWQLMRELTREHTRRWPGHVHKYAQPGGVVDHLFHVPDAIPVGGLTPFAQAMPEEYRGPDAVEAYRRYYMGAKRDLAVWRAPALTPSWWR